MRGLLVAAAAIGMMAPLNGKAEAAPKLSASTHRDYGETQANTGKEQYNCTPRPEGCGQTQPGSTFKVEKGMIFCSGTPIGLMYPTKKYLNFTLRLEYRFPPYAGMESVDEFFTAIVATCCS
jgi:hypothetical protein